MTASHGSVKGYWIAPAREMRLYGMSPAARIHKQMEKSGVINRIEDETDLPKEGHILLLRGDVAYDNAVLQGLIQTPDSMVAQDGIRYAAHVKAKRFHETKKWLDAEVSAPEGMLVLTPAEAGGAYNHMLRKREAASCHIVTPGNIRDVEWRLFKTAYKGVTDIVTKYVWPVPAFHATRLCAALGLTPNFVTTLGAVLMFLALWLFWEGHYGWGLLAGWIMTFLDTVDGKLARVTLSSSKWGNIFDHGIDLLHPPFWYIAWGMGLAVSPPWLATGLWMMFVFYVLGRLVEGYFMRRFGMHLHVWRRFDSWFRLILARRNPNMIMLTLCWGLGRPDIGLLLVIIWTTVTFFVHIVQVFQAEWECARGRKVSSWLSASA